MQQPFKFKQFTVNQDRCAMKVGTDGVLLGAWAPLAHQPNSILDIGSGTGILSLMLAQRSNAEILDAIEIDEPAFEQSVDNFEHSPWGDRLFCYHASFAEFAEEIEEKYDMIVCNPPFFKEDYKSENQKRALARFQDAMPFEHLLESVSVLLNKAGLFCAIIPYAEEERFIRLALSYGLFPKHICHVKGTISSEVKRCLISFTFSKAKIEYDELVIEISRHNYTQKYMDLTKDFYLKM
ncbi:MAG: methyltransferase [Bacteroidota bacterium]